MLRKLMVLVVALLKALMMSVPAMAAPGGDVCTFVFNPDGTIASEECPGNSELGNKDNDGEDANRGGGTRAYKEPSSSSWWGRSARGW